ncbi:N-acetylglucosamine kinase [Pedobacter sp. P351]|uniref:N-acetylglucosamine kinase n=1 Tax=Pedobacter superstes TaxID=3133441 RepID=UPI0030A07184
MILIADGGSTKTSWCVIDSVQERSYFETEGYNPYFVSSEYIIASLTRKLPAGLNPSDIRGIYFYGAGVQNESKAKVIKDALGDIFLNSVVFVGHDLLASARALLGVNSGFAAILGTGTNSCLYNGKNITHHIDSGAHILGDEGSGFYIGKKLLIDYIRGQMPVEISASFKEIYQLTVDDIHEAVYSKPLANRYCAGFSRFINDANLSNTYVRDVVKSSFDDFFRKIVSRYPKYEDYTFNCVGSVGYSFSGILTEVAKEWGMEVGKIIKTPLPDLVNYHMIEGSLTGFGTNVAS